ncbi:hypothetical protein FO519_002762 [Halicephalobus sp. NKZ332]|nr:hypothetical protein FO519_002762 [Halicephalobus sp. NKZ332]
MIDQPSFLAVGNFTLPQNSRMNYSPGAAYTTFAFSSMRRPWLRFSVIIYPKSKSPETKNFVSLFIKLQTPKSLHQAQISAKVELSFEGFAQNKRIECERILPKRTIFSIDNQECGWEKLFKRDHLFKTYPEILRRGRFAIRVVVSFCFIGHEILFEPSILGDHDCWILCRQSRLRGHRQLLQKHSRLVDFQVRLNGEDPEVIRFHNFDPSTVYAAILFVYSGFVNPHVSIQNLYRFAVSYGFDMLKVTLSMFSLS